MTEQEQKAEQAWKSIRKMNWDNEYAENGIINQSDFNKAISDFKSSLKREIEKWLEELNEKMKVSSFKLNVAYLKGKIEECEKFLELLNTVEP